MKILIGTLLALGLLGCKTPGTESSPSTATSVESGKAESAVFEAMIAAGQNIPQLCHQNIIDLINNLQRQVPSFDVESATVLFFHPRETTDVSMQVFAAPQGRFRWFHHVVMLYRGKIYDLSFGKSPRIVPPVAYLREMFLGARDPLPEPQNAQMITVKRVPATVWRDEYGKQIDGETHDASFFRRTKKYRPRTLDTFLAELESSASD
jgi:hypothetical protein